MLIKGLRAILRALGRRNDFETGLNDEIQFHIEQRASDLARTKGLTPQQALRQAQVEFGGRETVRDECRRSLGLRWLDELRQDIAYAYRTLRRQPAFALVAITTLAVGIGGNTAMFSVLDAVILKTLPVRSPEQLFLVRHDTQASISQRYSWPFIQHLMNAAEPNAHAAAMTRVNNMRMGVAFDAPTASVQLVSGNWFDVIGVDAAAAGRLLSVDDNRTEGAHPVTVVSATFWKQQFGEVPFATGREVRVNGYPLQIVGVAPASFRGVLLERPVDIWAPLTMQHQLGHKNNFSASNARPDQPWPSQNNIRWLEVIVRSSSPRQLIETALNSGMQGELLESGFRQGTRASILRLEPFSRGFSNLRADFARPIYALVATVTLVLLIVCANIANLLLARASQRRREIAVRLSLGAGRGRLIRQMLTESLLIAACGALAGLGIANWATGVLSQAATRVGATRFHLTLDPRVLTFTMSIAVGAAILFGLLPALRGTRLDPAPALKSGARETHGGSRIRLAGLLVSAQVTLSVLLLSGAALFLHSLRNLVTFDPGFRASNLLGVHLDLDPNLKGPALSEFLRVMVERVNVTPGVQGSALAVCPLVADCTNSTTGFVVPGYVPQMGEQITFQTEAVSPDFFSMAGIRLISGREFSWRDNFNSHRVVVVNEALVRRYFAGKDPVGRTISYPGDPDMLVVGVVRDVRVNSVRRPAVPMIWSPASQMTLISGPTLHVRVEGSSPRMKETLRQVVSAIDSRSHATSITSLPEQIGLSLWREYLLAALTASFGGLALFLACFGLYGVMSHVVARRTQEMGVRLALGAQPRQVLWHTMRESLTLVAIGLAFGLPLALAAERLVHDLLFNVSPGDPLSIATAAMLLLGSASLAAYLPSRRASRVDPIIALRYE